MSYFPVFTLIINVDFFSPPLQLSRVTQLPFFPPKNAPVETSTPMTGTPITTTPVETREFYHPFVTGATKISIQTRKSKRT